MEQEYEHSRDIMNRSSRAIGHLSAVKRMLEEGRDCNEVLIQLSAVRAQLANLSKLILKEHIEHCLVEAVNSGDEETLKNLEEAIDKLL